jgi:hypothetical protein
MTSEKIHRCRRRVNAEGARRKAETVILLVTALT